MGREARTSKDRTCLVCEREFVMTAAEIKEHARLCKRAAAIGLVLPGLVRPSTKIIGV